MLEIKKIVGRGCAPRSANVIYLSSEQSGCVEHFLVMVGVYGEGQRGRQQVLSRLQSDQSRQSCRHRLNKRQEMD